MKQTTDYNEVPECCKRCVYARKKFTGLIWFKDDDMTQKQRVFIYKCIQNLHLPTKKQQCKKQKLTIKHRFIKFLKDENIDRIYLKNLKNRQSNLPKKTNPKYLIYNAFCFFRAEGYSAFWQAMHKKWVEILRKEYGG